VNSPLQHARNVVTSRLREAGVPFSELAGGRIQIGEAVFPLAWAGNGLPRDVERLRIKHRGSLKGVIVAARRFSPRAIQQLESEGAHWSDEAGRTRIVAFDPVIAITITGPPLTPSRDDRGFEWSPAALDVAELLLVDRQVPQLRDIVARTDWSLGRISQIMSSFDAQGFTRRSIESQRARREIDAPLLLDSWSRAMPSFADLENQMNAHSTDRDVDRVTARVATGLGNLSVDFALTGWSGLAQAAPFTTIVPSLELYVRPGTLDTLRTKARTLGLTVVNQPGSILIREAPAFALDAAIKPIHWPVIHPARLYADLLALGGRGRDAARHVADEFRLVLPDD
jgi:hypothetical protein